MNFPGIEYSKSKKPGYPGGKSGFQIVLVFTKKVQILTQIFKVCLLILKEI